MTTTKQITTHNTKLEVEFEFTPGEINNYGHPDDRMEDAQAEVEIISIWHKGEDILLLMTDDVVADIELILLQEAVKQAI